MNKDNLNWNTKSDRSFEDIEDKESIGTPLNVENVLVSTRAKSHCRSDEKPKESTGGTSKPGESSDTDGFNTFRNFFKHGTNSQGAQLRRAVGLIHEDKEFLIAAEIGNEMMLEILISDGVDIQQMDYLGRNALHLAVCADSKRAIVLLLDAGIRTNVKDMLGMTPLSLCLMRRPSLEVANLLFDHGAKVLPRSNPMDTGLFIQFVMMSTPTEEEVKILELLTTKGALINDPEAPGGRQPLHFAAMSDNCPLIQVLVDLGADLNLVNHRNETPLEVALSFKCRNAYTFLQMLNDLKRYSDDTRSKN